MTNWLTAAGLALFAGGLATLICFRSVLFGDGRRRTRRGSRASDAPRRSSNSPRRAATVEQSRRGRRRSSGQPLELLEAQVTTTGVAIDLGNLSRDDEDDDRGGLASIGFADDEDEIEEIHQDEVEDPDEEPEPPTVLDRSPRRVGHRVEGWVRPEYHDYQPGEYWTPPPSVSDPQVIHRDENDREPSAYGYGWPVPVERLPPVPAYVPATGFDLEPVAAEPTEVVPAWSTGDDRPDRIHLPRSWSSRDEKPRRRPRPRPRPAASIDGNGVYVSRHAADPPR